MNSLLPQIEAELARENVCDLVCTFWHKGQRRTAKERIVRMPDGSLRSFNLSDEEEEIVGEHKGHRGDLTTWLDYFDACGYAVRPRAFAAA